MVVQQVRQGQWHQLPALRRTHVPAGTLRASGPRDVPEASQRFPQGYRLEHLRGF